MTKIVESTEENDYKMPKELGTAKLHYKLTLEDGGRVIADSRADGNEEPVTHVLDEAELLCPAVEMALKKMKKGGVSKLQIKAPQYGFGEEGSADLGVPASAVVCAEIELVEFENEKDSWDLNEEEKLAAAEAKKVKGNEKAKAKDWARAIRRYESAKTALASDHKMSDEQKEQAKALKITLHTNLAMVHEKIGDTDAVSDLLACLSLYDSSRCADAVGL